MSFSKPVEALVMVVTDQEGAGTEDTVFEDQHPGHNPNPYALGADHKESRDSDVVQQPLLERILQSQAHGVCPYPQWNTQRPALSERCFPAMAIVSDVVTCVIMVSRAYRGESVSE